MIAVKRLSLALLCGCVATLAQAAILPTDLEARVGANCVMRVVDQKLYAMKLEGLANQSFDAVAAQFDQLVTGAELRK